MSTEGTEIDAGHLNRETWQLWESKAEFWDERMGEGNQFQRVLVGPATERLLQIRPGERVLEIACGNGVMSRRLAQLGANVVATDFSPTFLDRARAGKGEYAGRLEYVLVDATDERQLLKPVSPVTTSPRRCPSAKLPIFLPSIASILPCLYPVGGVRISLPCTNS